MVDSAPSSSEWHGALKGGYSQPKQWHAPVRSQGMASCLTTTTESEEIPVTFQIGFQTESVLDSSPLFSGTRLILTSSSQNHSLKWTRFQGWRFRFPLVKTETKCKWQDCLEGYPDLRETQQPLAQRLKLHSIKPIKSTASHAPHSTQELEFEVCENHKANWARRAERLPTFAAISLLSIVFLPTPMVLNMSATRGRMQRAYPISTNMNRGSEEADESATKHISFTQQSEGQRTFKKSSMNLLPAIENVL